ncbi:MAG: 5-formyltetrahydrofolate cyclo-ligase [Pseudomonadota bacterium]|nr:5-formyltetrahydrofolate cyclo-ligase [Pseudomonadota bacterium]
MNAAGVASSVGAWRQAERERRINIRLGMSAADRAAETDAIVEALDGLVTLAAATVVSVYWPIRGEPDLRGWMHSVNERGARVVLPVALAVGQPLAFREWHPSCRMTRGLWNIPYPADGDELPPNVVIAPVVGFDRECYRLGYGGGFFDRTLAALPIKPVAIGVGFRCAAVESINPQPHDIPMRWIVAAGETIARCPRAGAV